MPRHRRSKRRPFGLPPYLIVGPTRRTAPTQHAYLCDRCGRHVWLDPDRTVELIAGGAVVRCIDCAARG